MNSLTLYHNPRCSKSRQTLALLREAGHDPVVIEYLKTPPDAGQITGLLDALGMQPRELMRKNEAPYRDLGLADESLGREALIAAIADHPILMQRPIVVSGDKAVIGRPPENALGLLPS